MPSIISGEFMAFFDPQEKIWEGKSGQRFLLSDLLGSDYLKCLSGIAHFDSRRTSTYQRTLFRFPLREVKSDLSDNIHTVQSVNKLIDTLRSEAKILLLFLRSVHTIEVYNINCNNQQTLILQTKIEDSFVSDLKCKRERLVKELKSHSYKFSKLHRFIVEFNVSVYDDSTINRRTTSHWMVCNQVDSTNPLVRKASAKQKVFPWVGAALETDTPITHGRIFCFLPMPKETVSNFPVHVNGTFSLSNDRRSLKWPEAERKNDDTANWNRMLVEEVLPSCYASLLLKFRDMSDSIMFYKAWPNVLTIEHSEWELILKPLFTALLMNDVIWCEINGEWVKDTSAVFIPNDILMEKVTQRALVNCHVKLAEKSSNVWNALKYIEMPMLEATAGYTRDKIRDNPQSYSHFSADEKMQLLLYCLSDENYSELVGLNLLLLVSNSFVAFEDFGNADSFIYLCTKECPSWLLPNLEHRLVDVTGNNDLHQLLLEVANEEKTQLRVLTVEDVASLLNEAMEDYVSNGAVMFSYSKFSKDWFSNFWKWIRNHSLESFQNTLILPVHCSHSISVSREFQVVKLTKNQPVVYVSNDSSASGTLLSVFDKLMIKYCTRANFQYVQHAELSDFVHYYNPVTLLNLTQLVGGCSSISFTPEEAYCFMQVMYNVGKSLYHHRQTAQKLKIFRSCDNSNKSLYSISQLEKCSFLRKVVVISTNAFDTSVLPPEVVVLSNNDIQRRVLLNLGFRETTADDFFTKYIFPRLSDFEEIYIDGIMKEVLNLFSSLVYRNSTITSSIRQLYFVKSGDRRKRPCDLYDPTVSLVCSIFKGENVFPLSPYDSPKYLHILGSCGLQSSVDPQSILDVIYKLSFSNSTVPQEVKKVRMLRIRAIIEYISSKSFYAPAQNIYTIDSKTSYMSFSEILKYLSQFRCWLPVQSTRPSNYPLNLPWKGEKFSSHVTLLNDSTCLSTSMSTTLPLKYGTKAFFTVEFDFIEHSEPTHYLVPHLKEVIAHKSKLEEQETLSIVKEIYSSMLKNKVQYTESTEWVYIQALDKFVHAHSVFLKPHPELCMSFAPYLNILPDSISSYKDLFVSSGMATVLSRSQILSVLKTLQREVTSGSCSVTAKEAWTLVLSILDWIMKSGTIDVEAPDFNRVLVPRESCNDLPVLMTPDNLVYTDSEFLRNCAMSTVEPKFFVHKRIHQSLAKHLCVAPLSKELGVSEDILDDAGQSESLIVRLKNILKDYKDGVSIIKEMIQNADDANASVVKICFDNRKHDIDTKNLIFSNMSKAHGPAIVVYNDSTFSNEDFTNILKLAGATKESSHFKIGKYGIGFCSVYHITDVPSFVSRSMLHILDPTLEHLSKEVKNTNQPGKKVNFLSKLIQLSSQMKPYEGLFGFDSRKEYNGTLFRLPIRTSASQLSSTCYSQHDKNELLKEIKEASNKLLLFLHNVNTISVQEFESGMSKPKVLFEVHKSQLLAHTFSDCSQVLSQYPCDLSKCSQVLIKSQDYKSFEKCSSYWLVSSYTSNTRSKPAVAEVACQLQATSCPETYVVKNSLEGESFCSLPLSQTTGLPVHVSCNFAVINNRRGLWTSSDNGSFEKEKEVKWNIFLMDNVIPVAYTQLLLYLKHMQSMNSLIDYEFYTLWPLTSKIQQQNPWEKFIYSFYVKLSSLKLFYSKSTDEWLSKRQSKFLDLTILGQVNSEVCIQGIVKHLKLPAVNLLKEYRSHLNLEKECITENEFVCLFFESLTKFNQIKSSRNSFILYALEYFGSHIGDITSTHPLLSKFIRNSACIPSSPDGRLLKKCCDLVNPKTSFAKLFEESDHYFPSGPISSSDLAMIALQNCGLMHSSLRWEILKERAQSIQKIAMEYMKEKALTAVQLIIKTIYDNIQHGSPGSELHFDDIPFLPVLPKPADYPLPWFGDEYELTSGKQLVKCEYSEHSRKTRLDRICGSQVAFVNEEKVANGGCGYINDIMTTKLLGLKGSPTNNQVILHLKEIIKTCDLDQEWVNKACSDIYDFFENSLQKTDGKAVNLDDLKDLPLAWNGQKFLSLECLSHNWKLDQGPYLFKVPAILSSKTNLSRLLPIKKEFDFCDAVTTLQRMKEDFGDNEIDESCIALIKELTSVLEKIRSNTLSKDFNLYLPGNDLVMHLSSSLYYNNTEWIPLEEGCVEVHSLFAKELALKLKVKPTRSKILEKYTAIDSFGQHENLTTRIQGIMRDYDFDITILKELLQNADDAKASKVCIILDKRGHKDTSVLSENWKELQGPALLVWNDSVFSKEDYKGIQNLGLGSKRYDDESIGKYGIGFNVVYHLTDCPSFISGGETLCIFDPHCRYVPQASERHPGAMFNLTSEFWSKFSDLSSAYLQSGDIIHEDFQKGTLFRFPLRHTDAMVKNSEIFDDGISKCSGKIETEMLSTLIDQWMPQIKDAIFFLSHVNEIKYIEISTSKWETKFHYKTIIDRPKKSFHNFEKLLSSFSEEKKSSTCQYQISIIDVVHRENCNNIDADKRESAHSKWLIQQGIGDLDNSKQDWSFTRTMKPRHAIAVPLSKNMLYRDNWKGNMFCFLPLPSLSSGIPAHLNASFFLDSHRRGLWKSSSSNSDDRSKWNNSLFEAIASSYVQLLIDAKGTFLSSTYESWSLALRDLNNYYSLFPHVHLTNTEENSTGALVLKKLVSRNSKVLCVLSSTENNNILVSWHPIISKQQAEQVYFWVNIAGSKKKIIHPILESVGMKVTPAPAGLMKSFNNIIRERERIQRHRENTEHKELRVIPALQPNSVFQYYTRFSKFNESQGMKPTPIELTSFKTIARFMQFLNYILGIPIDDHTSGHVNDKESSIESNKRTISSVAKEPNVEDVKMKDEETKMRRFPDSPFSHFLLVTADGVLRSFDETKKVLNSKFFAQFSKKQCFFLHPDCQTIKFDPSYFITPYEEEREGRTTLNNDFSHILNVLGSLLSPVLCESTAISYASKIISKDTLISVWDCLHEDEVFKSYSNKILEHYCLLLTIDDRLLSINNDVLPCVIESQPVEEDSFIDSNHMIAIMKALQMPFLDTRVIFNVEMLELPSLSKHDKILCNFYHVNQQMPLTAIFKSDSSHYDTLISYFSQAAKPSDQTWLYQISSLPIFATIDGKHLSLSNKRAYICPDDMCASGCEKWITEPFVFIRSAQWTTMLGSVDQFKMRPITYEELYCKFIFPKFSQLNEAERHEHLVLIKHVYFSWKYRCDKEITGKVETTYNARTFVESLKELKCIEMPSGLLDCIKSFSDHKVKLFHAFPNDFYLLPTKFQENEWLPFFKELGLQQKLTKRQFIKLCRKVSTGEVGGNTNECSEALLKYLFCEERIQKWFKKNAFLNEVSKIAFVPALNTSKVNWISRSYSNENNLVCLNGSATKELMSLLWTVKPIVHIPIDQHQQICSKRAYNMLYRMNFISAANSRDVVSNISNICANSPYTDERLLQHYPEKFMPKENQNNFLEVMSENFKHSHESQISILQKVSCIPVFCDPMENDKKKVALVNPTSVISTRKTSSLECYYPYLHRLPEELLSAMSILLELGVESNLEVHHMQTVLEKVFTRSEGKPLDPNAMSCVEKALNFLFDNITADYSPNSKLYLPDTENHLRLSTNMLYSDSLAYHRKIDLNLKGLHIYHFDKTEVRFGFSASDFCRILPDKVRPKAMSLSCKQIPDEQSLSVFPSERTMSIETLLHHETNSFAVMQAFKIILKQKAHNSLESIVQDYFISLKVEAKQDMKTKIVLRKDVATVIGFTVSKFYFESCDIPRTIFIDEEWDEFDLEDVFSEIADTLCELLLKEYKIQYSPHVKQFTSFIERFLKTENSKKHIFLQRYDIVLPTPTKSQFEFTVGQVIPIDYHHQLQQDISNLFSPREYVAYERPHTQQFIVAQIIHFVRPDDDDDGDNECCTSQVTRKYRIRISNNEMGGEEIVSIVYLYKIIPSDETNERTFVPHEISCGKPASETITMESDIEDIKEKIQRDLHEISKLDSDLQQSAFKRMYLMWHPDKNLENTSKAEEIFVFLKEEIESFSRNIGKTEFFSDSSNEFFSTCEERASQYYYMERKATSNSHFTPPNSIYPDHEEGRKWIAQAEIDFRVLCAISTCDNACNFHGHVCFMAHQVAEKALKGGAYILCGLDDSSLHQHDIVALARDLETVKPEQTRSLVNSTTPLRSYYLNTRYPNRWSGSEIPADHYEEADAGKARVCAEQILDIIKAITH